MEGPTNLCGVELKLCFSRKKVKGVSDDPGRLYFTDQRRHERRGDRKDDPVGLLVILRPVGAGRRSRPRLRDHAKGLRAYLIAHQDGPGQHLPLPAGDGRGGPRGEPRAAGRRRPPTPALLPDHRGGHESPRSAGAVHGGGAFVGQGSRRKARSVLSEELESGIERRRTVACSPGMKQATALTCSEMTSGVGGRGETNRVSRKRRSP